jgi:hypothetical protein
MKDKIKHMYRPKYRFLGAPITSFENSGVYSMLWIEDIVFDIWELANFFNKSVKCEGCYLYEVPGVRTKISGKTYILHVFEQFWE